MLWFGPQTKSRALPPLKTKSSLSRAEEALARRTAYWAKHRRASDIPTPRSPAQVPKPQDASGDPPDPVLGLPHTHETAATSEKACPHP